MTVETSTWATKKGLAQMLKGGVIMDVVTPDQAKVAEDAGAVAVMALERVPADIRKAGGVARMSDPSMIEGIMDAVTIPVMAKARIGHFVEAQVLEALGVDYIDESEVLTPADERNHIDKHAFKVPFVCGCRNLGEALRRINEGSAMMRTKGEAGTGNIVSQSERDAGPRSALHMRDDELFVAAKGLGAPYDLVGRWPPMAGCRSSTSSAASTPSDAPCHSWGQRACSSLGIFKSEACPDGQRIVQATTFSTIRRSPPEGQGPRGPDAWIALGDPGSERLAVGGW
jgi:pyridoxal 5'-phosphate synthase pdxS subunit